MRPCRWCLVYLEDDAADNAIYHRDPCAREAALHNSNMHARTQARDRERRDRERRKRERLGDSVVSSRTVTLPIWTCPKCGPVSDALFGSDEEFHCSSLECDEVVRILSEAEVSAPRPNDFSRNYPSASDDKKREQAQTRAEARAESIRASKEGRGILAAMAKRGRSKVATTKQGGDGGAKTRHGKCDGCQEVKWLLRKEPPTCAACYRVENPPDHSKDAAAKRGKPAPDPNGAHRTKTGGGDTPDRVLAVIHADPGGVFTSHSVMDALGGGADDKCVRNALARFVKKGVLERVGRGEYRLVGSKPEAQPRRNPGATEAEAEEPAPRRRPSKPRPPRDEPVEDDLSHECRAIEECSRALEGLSPQAIERVLGYTLHRYSQRSGLATRPLFASLLPGPTSGS